MSVKFSLNTKKFERDLKKTIEKDLKKHPEQVLDNHIGETIEAICPRCGFNQMSIIKGGKCKCTKCNHTEKINVNIRYK